MADVECPQIYLVTPPSIDLSTFPDRLAAVLDAEKIACVRLALAGSEEEGILRAADVLREITHARDVALVIERHVLLVERLGLDGVHLPDGARSVRKTRKDLGEDAIIGAYCHASRHEGISAAEAGADYIAFGPVGSTPLGDGTLAEADLFGWWSEMIEVPVVAEGALNEKLVATLSPFTDFFAFGSEVWSQDDPLARLRQLVSAML